MKHYRIAITGPESSGKSTLAKSLAQALNANLIEEYVREYARERNLLKFSLEDILSISQEQFTRNSISDTNFKYQICDTEMTVLKIWAKDKFKKVPQLISTLYEKQEFDIIFLCKPDFEWQFDPLREDKNRGEELFGYYLEELDSQKAPYYIVEGSKDNRKAYCLSRIEELLIE